LLLFAEIPALYAVVYLVSHLSERPARPDEKVDEVTVSLSVEALRCEIARRPRRGSNLIEVLEIATDRTVACVLEDQSPKLRTQLPDDEFLVTGRDRIARHARR
jgi:hypothetical protein